MNATDSGLKSFGNARKFRKAQGASMAGKVYGHPAEFVPEKAICQSIIQQCSELTRSCDEIHVAAWQEICHALPHLMIQSLHIENFRCFRDVHLDDLGRVNILAGGNGSGKTAFLEALFLPGSDHQAAFGYRAWRGIASPPNYVSRAMYESCWKDLFFRFSQNQIIKIEILGTPENKRTVRVFYDSGFQMPLPLPSVTQPGQPLPSVSKVEPQLGTPLVFETTDAAGKKYSNHALFDPNTGGLVMSGSKAPVASIRFIPTNSMVSVADEFSRIDMQKNGKTELIKSVKKIFPEIADLSVLSPAGFPDLYATINELPEKVPIGLISGGVRRFLAILLSIAERDGGVILVDEIENGIYHESFGTVWRAIFTFCEKYDVQLFAATHCLECLDALQPLLSEHEDKFRLLRTEKCPDKTDGSHTVRLSKGRDFLAALETGTEIR